MLTCRSVWSGLAVAVALAALALSGCAAHGSTGAGDDIGELEGELGVRPTAAGIRTGSPQEEGVLLLVNDRSVGVETLTTRTKLPSPVAGSITAFRTAADGAPRWFASVDEIDALPGADTQVFVRLVADARQTGYTEAPGFDPPTLARISVPSGLGRPPTANDVTVEAGFDGKPSAETAALVRGRITNAVHASNERFVAQTIADTHKAFTIAIGNLFAHGSPPAAFAASLGADELTMLGTMSAVHPTILVATKGGVKSTYARGATGRYEPLESPRYPVIMRARVRLETGAADDPGQGVRIFCPAWSAKVLSGPTTIIIEGSP